MPVFLIGAVVNNKANFMPAAWVSRVNSNPNIMAVSLSPQRYTYQGVKEHKAFSINVPNANLVAKTDYCGSVSGRNTDKSVSFDVFYGENKNVPMIQECPICAECKIIQKVSLPDHELLIAEIINIYVNEKCLTNKIPDIAKIKPFIFNMADNNYWMDGKSLGRAGNLGKVLK